jgi:hypothetical protein
MERLCLLGKSYTVLEPSSIDMQLKSLTAILPLLATASAFPSLFLRENNSTSSNKSKTCVIPAGGSNATDDTPAINKALTDCAKDGTVIFEEGVD